MEWLLFLISLPQKSCKQQANPSHYSRGSVFSQKLFSVFLMSQKKMYQWIFFGSIYLTLDFVCSVVIPKLMFEKFNYLLSGHARIPDTCTSPYSLSFLYVE